MRSRGLVNNTVMRMNIEYPALLMSQRHFEGGFKNYRELAHCGVVNLEKGSFLGYTIFDSDGNEFIIKSAKKGKLYNPLNPFNIFKKYREIIAELEIEKTKTVEFEELKNKISEILHSKKIDGSPFLNKEKDINEFLNQFSSTRQLVSEIGFFSYK